MLTNNKVSIKNIIARVYQDLGLTEEIDIGTIIEWTADVLDKINVYQQLDSKEACIEICNYKAEIPYGFVYLDTINYNGYQLDQSISNTLFNKRDSYPYYTTPHSYNASKLENISFEYGMKYYFNNSTKDSFIMQDGYFKTSFCDGKLYITYKQLPIDEEGFPLIPDDISFKEAIFWYVAYKYFYIKSIKDQSYRWFYQDADQKYRYYIGQAGANAMMPDVHTLENIKRNYLKLIPSLHSYKSFFTDLNK